MPQHKDAKKRRRTFFARIPSTFTKNNSLSSVCSITEDNDKLLHSKSTYFYRWGSRGKKLSSKVTFLIPSVCGLALLVGGIVAVNPTSHSGQVYASITTGGTTGENTDSTDTKGSSVSLFIGGDLLEPTQATASIVAYRSNLFNVTATGISQYVIALSAADGFTGKLHGMANPDVAIDKVDYNTPPDKFENNTWGYAVTDKTTFVDYSALEYRPVPDSSPVILASQKDITTDIDVSRQIVFAARLGADLPSDHYITRLQLSVVSDAADIAALDFIDADGNKITTMQEMTRDTCARTAEGATVQLRDVRDNKIYWIAKLKDGNCWMTQNLDFNIPEELDPTTSDLGSSTENVNTNTIPITTIPEWYSYSSNHYNAYLDLGDYVYNGPNGTHGNGVCNNYSGVTSLSSCSGFSEATSTSDMHYHIGNYYTYSAASVTSGDTLSTDGSKIDKSICPRGWQLPDSGEMNNTTSGSFGYLLSQYGFANNSSVRNSSYDVYGAPLYFVYGGWPRDRLLYSAGGDGYYWSSTVRNNTSDFRVYNFFFSTSVSPYSTNQFSNYGMSVRCMALGA